MSIDLSLDRLRQLVGQLPAYTRPTIHIAGTNGKGSVSAYISHILVSSRPAFKVGRYNSPHLLVVHDSITIDNKPISAHSYAAARSFIEEADQRHKTRLSPFELLTLTAFHIFEKEKVDIAVIEVGMGGRLDATNILPTSVILVSALTSVDLDHQAFLGPTVAHIAKEKASIARPGRPFIVAKQKHPEVGSVVRTVVTEQGGILLQAIEVSQREWTPDLDGGKSAFSLSEPPHLPVSCQLPCFPDTFHTSLPLFGEHQLENLGVALAVISALFTHLPVASFLDFRSRITPESISDGVRSTRWPGRLSFHTIDIPTGKLNRRAVVLVDGAHNPASSETLGNYLNYLASIVPGSSKPLRLAFVLALSHSPPKTPAQTLSPLFHLHGIEVSRVALLRFTPPDGMPWVKPVPPCELRNVVETLVSGTEVWVSSDSGEKELGNKDLTEALKWASDCISDISNSLIVVAGSLYLVADFYRLVGSGSLAEAGCNTYESPIG